MSKTNAELRDRVAKDLGLKAQDQELSDELSGEIEGRIVTARAHYAEVGLFWWADDAIPDAVFDPLAALMCALCCAAVRKAGQGHEEKLPPALAAIASLKPSARVETLRTQYY